MNRHTKLIGARLLLAVCLLSLTVLPVSASDATGPYIVLVGGTAGAQHNWTPFSNTVRQAEVGGWADRPIGGCYLPNDCGYAFADQVQVGIQVGDGGTLSFDWWMWSTVDKAFDWVDIYLVPSGGPNVPIVTHANPACPSGYLCEAVFSPTTHVEFDLTPYANRRVTLVFETRFFPLADTQGAMTQLLIENLQVGSLPGEPYEFNGYLLPLKNPPALNSMVAGRSVSIKFSLTGFQGPNIMAPDFPASRPIACDSGAALGEDEIIDWFKSDLIYKPDRDAYVLIWKTNAAWAGTCRQLTIQTDDGSIHRLNFKFN